MKKALIVAAVVVVALAVAGVLYGPRLYRQIASRATPFGEITRVETVESLPGSGNEAPMQAPSGQRLWLVHFQPPPEKEEGDNAAGSGARPEDARLIDDTGEKHAPLQMMGQIRTKDSPSNPGFVSLHMEIKTLVFALPIGRAPRSLQVGDAPPVDLP